MVEGATPEQEAQSVLTPVWRDGEFVRKDTFDVIRSRALKG
jgi:hypothetical protein